MKGTFFGVCETGLTDQKDELLNISSRLSNWVWFSVWTKFALFAVGDQSRGDFQATCQASAAPRKPVRKLYELVLQLIKDTALCSGGVCPHSWLWFNVNINDF